jgi:hypothetical protein
MAHVAGAQLVVRVRRRDAGAVAHDREHRRAGRRARLELGERVAARSISPQYRRRSMSSRMRKRSRRATWSAVATNGAGWFTAFGCAALAIARRRRDEE